MGAYVNPRTGNKLSWLLDHGEPTRLTKAQELIENTPTDCLAICLIDNGAFQALGIGFDKREIADFAIPDGRMKLWYFAPIVELHKVSPELAGYMK